MLYDYRSSKVTARCKPSIRARFERWLESLAPKSGADDPRSWRVRIQDRPDMLGFVAFGITTGPVALVRSYLRLAGERVIDVVIWVVVHLLGPCGFLCAAQDALLAVHTGAPDYQREQFNRHMFEAGHWLEVMGRSIKWERGLRRLVEEVNRR